MKKLCAALVLFLLASTAHAEAVVYIPTSGPELSRRFQFFWVPVTIEGFTNPTGNGARWLEVNVIASPGLVIGGAIQVGPWTISGNPNGYYGWIGQYVDGWHMKASWINDNATRLPGCITAEGGVAFSIPVTVADGWTHGPETLTLGRSIKSGPMPKLLDCAGNSLPISYGNTVCVMSPPEGAGGDEGGCCQEPPVTITLEGPTPKPTPTKTRTTWGRIKALYR